MGTHVRCSCGARLKVTDAMQGRKSKCPHCGRVFRMAPAGSDQSRQADRATPDDEIDAGYAVEPALATPDPADPVWVPHQPEEAPSRPARSPRRGRKVLTALAILIPVLATVALVVIPPLLPKDDRAEVVGKYLKAVQEGRLDEADRLAVIDEHPRIDAHDEVVVNDQDGQRLAGRFDGLSRLHRKMDEDYDWHSHRGRFFKTDRIGTGLEVLDQLTDAKKQLDESGAYDKLYQIGETGAKGDEGFDAMLQIFGSVGNLATHGGPVSRDVMSPSYETLMDRLNPDLTDEEKALAKAFAFEPMKWDKLLGRDFVSLKGGGQFELEESTATTRVYGKESFGDEGRVMILRLVRFRLGTIDTGWRVWSVNYESPPAPRSYSEEVAGPSP